jgi:dTDP-L-rhamnose 4-epimerase
MSSYGEGLYRRPSDGALLRPNARTWEQAKQWGWEVADPQTGESLEPVAIPEVAALLSRNIYALSKRYQEEITLSTAETYNIPAVSLRLFNVYGPRQSLSNPYTGVLALFMSRILSGQAPIIYEDGLQSRDFISVHDVVQMVELAIASPLANGQIFNAGTGLTHTILEIAQTLAKLTGNNGLDIKPTLQFRKGDVRHCLADVARARQVLGYAPRTSWETGLRELLEWSQSAAFNDLSSKAQQELQQFKLLG